MNSNTNIGTVTPVQIAPASPASGGDFSDSRAAQEASRSARYRLVIEEGPTRGSFIYKTMDRVTGEVVQQLPREEVVRLLADEAYSAGSVFDTSA